LKLQLQVRMMGEVVVIQCSGRLTYRDEAAAFSEAISSLVSERSQVVIEMSGMEAIDSAGLGELAVIHMWARASGCALKLAGVSDRIQQLFELTNLASIFEVHPSLEGALQACQPQGSQAQAAGNAA